MVAALLSGALMAGASLPTPLGPLGFVGLAPLLRVLVRRPSLRLAFRDGFVAGLVFLGVGYAWVFQSTLAGGLAQLAYALGIPVLSIGFGLFALALAWIARRSRVLALVAAPGLWVGFEFARSWFIGVPWDHLGYAVADWPFLAQGAGVFGLYGLSAWLVAVNAGLVGMRRLPAAARVMLAAALATPLTPGLSLLKEGSSRDGSRDVLRVAAVQPAIDESQRHVPDRLQGNLRQLLDLTAPVVSEHADLVVWPESAWERALGPAGDAFLAAIAHDLATPLLTGAWRVPAAGETSWRNTAVLATRDGRTPVVAEKVHPVPLYERAPASAFARALARAGLWSGSFGPGDPSDPLWLPRVGGAPVRVGVLVCIDVGHPELARAARAAGARMLVVIANEAGTGTWSAALHARVARLRAIENRIPVVRVANTGPTLWIDAQGRVVAALPAGEPAAAVHAVALADELPAPTHRADHAVAASCLLSALAIAAARFIQPC